MDELDLLIKKVDRLEEIITDIASISLAGIGRYPAQKDTIDRLISAIEVNETLLMGEGYTLD